MNTLHIGILCAMPEEIGSTIKNLKNLSEKSFGDLTIFAKQLFFDRNDKFPLLISVAWSGWGKVSSARAATRLITSTYQNQFINLLLFTGVAGSAISEINQWDIVIPTELVQHDMDARPLFKKYEIPALKTVRIKSNKSITNWTLSSLKSSINKGSLESFGNLYEGLIVFIKKALPLTILTAIFGIVGLYLLNISYDLDNAILKIIFIGLASLTFPHILLEYLLEKNER